MNQRTDDLAAHSGVHRTSCACAVERRVQRSAFLPHCPVCMKRVEWALTRPEDTDSRAPPFQI